LKEFEVSAWIPNAEQMSRMGLLQPSRAWERLVLP